MAGLLKHNIDLVDGQAKYATLQAQKIGELNRRASLAALKDKNEQRSEAHRLHPANSHSNSSCNLSR